MRLIIVKLWPGKSEQEKTRLAISLANWRVDPTASGPTN
jgi:hypothetical protein